MFILAIQVKIWPLKDTISEKQNYHNTPNEAPALSI